MTTIIIVVLACLLVAAHIVSKQKDNSRYLSWVGRTIQHKNGRTGTAVKFVSVWYDEVPKSYFQVKIGNREEWWYVEDVFNVL